MNGLHTLRLATFAFFTAAAAPAFAQDAVLISRGSETGRGLVMVIEDRCLVLTAGHVAGDGSEPMRVVDSERRSAPARLLKADKALDIAVLEVADLRTAGRDLCNGKTSQVTVVGRTEALQIARGFPLVWIDKVETASGGWSRHAVSMLREAPEHHLLLGLMRGPNGGFEPGPGDSGSAVWIPRTRVTIDQLYQNDGTPRRLSSSTRVLLGLYVGRQNDRPVVVAADRVRDFVLDALEPIPQSVSTVPDTAKLWNWHRGEADSKGAPGVLEIDAAAVKTLGMQFDLGRRETPLRSVTVRLAGSPPEGSQVRRPQIDVYTSAFQPADAPDASWVRERCASTRSLQSPSSLPKSLSAAGSAATTRRSPARISRPAAANGCRRATSATL